MKKSIFKSLVLAAIIAPVITTTSCQKDLNEINETNPNQFNDSDPKLMITGAQLANVMLNEGEAARLAGIFAGHFTGYDRQYIAYGQYNMTSGDFNTPWATMYAEGVAQCRIIREKAIAANNDALEGVACITEANLLMTGAALWGDIPNSQACNPQYPRPAYDKMSDVYTYCITLLDTAINRVGSSSAFSNPYTGNFSWSEVANTLKARAYLHKKDYASAIAAALNGVAEGNDLYANHSAANPGAWNLYYDFLDWNRGGYMSCDGSFIHSLLDSNSSSYRGNTKTDESGRYAYYFFPDNGYTPVDPNWNDGIFTPDANFPLVSYVENELILAECYARTPDATKALEHLNNVRTYHDNVFGGYDSYDYAADFQSDINKLLKEIVTEKYVSLFGQIEAFNDVRRTNNLIGVTPATGTKLPGRFLYPQSEINSNPNTPPVGTLFDAVELFK